MAEKNELQKADAQPLAMQQKTVIDFVAGKVNEFVSNGQLALPPGYSPENAMKHAWLMMQAKPELMACTNDSIANAMLKMSVQGLNPGKEQCYFIAYGKSLTCQRSYFGSMAVAKTVNPEIGEFSYAVVYEGDTFKFGIKNGKKIIKTHDQELDNIDKNNIKAAYCIVMDKSGEPMRTEVMTFEEIKQSWKQSPMKPVSDSGVIKPGGTHDKFTADMALKTVINKTCKVIINSSDDSSLLLNTVREADDMVDRLKAEAEITGKANTGPFLSITEAPVQETTDEAAKHPAYDLCIEQRGCEKHERVSECDKANSETMRSKCVHGMELDKKNVEPKDVPCPNDADTLTSWTVCKGCSEINGCPVR